MSGDLSIRRPRRVTPLAPDARPSAPTATLRAPDEAEQLAVLQALERGEIDVDEASRRLGGGDA